jgi:hypothetical protein
MPPAEVSSTTGRLDALIISNRLGAGRRAMARA